MSKIVERKYVAKPVDKEYRVIEQTQTLAHPFNKHDWYIDRSYLVWDGDTLMFKLSEKEFNSMYEILREEE
jgi:hypothetical protein